MAHSSTLSGLRGCLLGSPPAPTVGNLQSVNTERCTGSSGTLAPETRAESAASAAPWARLQPGPQGSQQPRCPPCPRCSKQSVEQRAFEDSGRQRHIEGPHGPTYEVSPKGGGDGDLGDKVSLPLTTGTPLLACDQLLTPPTCSPQLAVCHGAQVGPQEGPESSGSWLRGGRRAGVVHGPAPPLAT